MRITDEVTRTVTSRVSLIACDGCGRRAGADVPQDWHHISRRKPGYEMHACTPQCAALVFGAYTTADAGPSDWWLISKADAKIVADALDGHGAAHAAYVFGTGLHETNAEPSDFSSVPKPQPDIPHTKRADEPHRAP